MKTSEKQLGYAAKYHQQFDDIKIRVVSGEREAMREYALSHGFKSLNECIVRMMNYAMHNNLSADDFRIK